MKDLNPKFLLVFLSVLTATGLFFAVFNWFDALKLPFIAQGNINAANLNSSLSTNSDVANLLDLQKKDTDLDGLSDYDELYVYHTSPYIADSDSDGISDGEEVKNNTDPNCPAGQVCNNTSITSVATASGTAPVLPESADNLTPDQLRSILLQAGVATEADLKNTSDADLQTIYQQAVAETPASGSANSANTNTNTNLQQASQLTPDQLRTLLINQGVKQADLQGVSNADLQQLWDQVLKESQAPANTNKQP
ncbi:MAG: thrombospondin type 3 repeat-containing protein [Candidatus Komeilibacteria bacterium]|nr:thrombospondin type 3 repeat-containing protein [Candidatus Komeilibacteria bacterium]